MAITFLEERKIQKRFILILGIILLIIALVIWQGFFVKEKSIWEAGEVLKPAKKIEINFEILKSPVLKGLEPFEEIKTYEEEISEGVVTEKIGRENPFLPY